MRSIIENELIDEPPHTIRDGGLFRIGINDSLDELRIRSGEGKDWLKEFEQKERERLNIVRCFFFFLYIATRSSTLPLLYFKRSPRSSHSFLLLEK